MTMRFTAVGIGVLLSAWLLTSCSAVRHLQVPPQPTGSIDGAVWDGGIEISDVDVQLKRNGQVVATAKTDEMARFQFDSLPRGDYLVLASREGYVPTVRRVNIGNRPVRVLIALDEIRPTETVANPTADVPTANFEPGASFFPAPAGLGAWPIAGRIAPSSPDPFRLTSAAGVSMFVPDVDSASFTYARSFLTHFGQLPTFDIVRTDELLNYLNFRYPRPRRGQPVSITTEIGPCPWAPEHRLALVGLSTRPIDDRQTRPRRIVLVIDPATASWAPYGLPRLKTALRSFVDTLRDEDRVAIVTLGAGLILPSTRGSERAQIHNAIELLGAQGVFFRQFGFSLAYEIAREHFVSGWVNGVIVATDRDFDLGTSDPAGLIQLIDRERQRGIPLSVLDVGRGGLREERTVKTLVDRGSARYTSVDSVQNARRVLAAASGATLETVARDVQFQVEFNPANVAAWKVIGYQNRTLERKEDFENTLKQGDELLAGDRVTMLYEIVPVGKPLPLDLVGEYPLGVDPLHHRTPAPTSRSSQELFTVKVRYTSSGSSTTRLMAKAVREGGPSRRVGLAATVAEFAQLLLDGDPDESRWRALTQRIDQLEPVVNRADQKELSSLVAVAAQTMRGRPSQIKEHSYRRMPDGREWTTENLAVDVVSPGTFCYERNFENCRRYRQLYTWQTALEGCQSLGRGWRLPTNEDWQQLAKTVGGVRDDSTDEGAAAYAALVTGGRLGFNAVFGGGRTPEGQYDRIGAHGFYWTATESDASHAWFYNFGGLKILNRHTDGEKTRALSVRCVRD